jgi:hypothetical protein
VDVKEDEMEDDIVGNEEEDSGSNERNFGTIITHSDEVEL